MALWFIGKNRSHLVSVLCSQVIYNVRSKKKCAHLTLKFENKETVNRGVQRRLLGQPCPEGCLGGSILPGLKFRRLCCDNEHELFLRQMEIIEDYV